MNLEDLSLEKLESMSPAVMLLTVLVATGIILLVFGVKLRWVVLLQLVGAMVLYPLIVTTGDIHHEVRLPDALRALHGCCIGVVALVGVLTSSVAIGWMRKRRDALESEEPPKTPGP